MAEEWKAVQCTPNSLIQLNGVTNFASMRSAQELSTLEATAPAFHHRVLSALKAGGKVRAEENIQPQRSYETRGQVIKASFRQGASVKDTKEKRKGVVIQAAAGYTKKSHTPVHRIADNKGNS